MDFKVVIIGGGDHGRGVLEILREPVCSGPRCEVIGFLDDAPEMQHGRIGGLPVLGGIDWIQHYHRADFRYVIAMADPGNKRRIVQRLGEQSLTFLSAIHSSVILAGGVRVEPGAILNAGVVVAYDTLIGAHSTVNLNATIGHDCTIGRLSTIAPGANLAGRVVVGEGCDVGMNATVAAGLSLGAWSSIGLGSVVIRDVASDEHVFGNPARRVLARSLA